MVTKVSLFPFPCKCVSSMPAQSWKELSTRFFKIKRLTTTTIDWNNSINQNHQPSKNRIQYQIKNIKSNTWSRSYKIIIPIQNRGVLFESHRAVVTLCWAIRPIKNLPTLKLTSNWDTNTGVIPNFKGSNN